MRGVAIFGVVFVHLFSDLYNSSWTSTGLNTAPGSLILALIIILYLGCWGGAFILISATGNMISMYNNYYDGKSPKSVMVKQIVAGFILLVISMSVEGFFQYYGFLGTLINGPIDLTRAIWHAYAMTPVTDLSICMILNGIIQYCLSIHDGYLKFKRNILIYVLIGIVVLCVTQPIWNWAKNVIPGYPNALQTYLPICHRIIKYLCLR